MSASVTRVSMVVPVPTRSMDTTVPACQGRWESTVKRVSSTRVLGFFLSHCIQYCFIFDGDISKVDNIVVPWHVVKSTDARSSNELRWIDIKIGHKYSSPSSGHQGDISSYAFFALLALCEESPPVTGGFPSQRPVTRSFDILFDLRLNNRLSKQSRRANFDITIMN